MANQTLPFHRKAFLNLIEAAEYSGVSARTLRRAVHARAIPHHRNGLSDKGKILIRVTDLDAYLERGRVNAIA